MCPRYFFTASCRFLRVQPETETSFLSDPPPWDRSTTAGTADMAEVAGVLQGGTIKRGKNGRVAAAGGSRLANGKSQQQQQPAGMATASEQQQQQQQQQYASSTSLLSSSSSSLNVLLQSSKHQQPRHHRQPLPHERHQALGRVNTHGASLRGGGGGGGGRGLALNPVSGGSRVVKGGTKGLFAQVSMCVCARARFR